MNICGGDCLKELLEKQTGQKMVAFREAMAEGPLSSDIFSAKFLSERASFHKSSQQEYMRHMKSYFSAYKKIKEGEEVCLWFGEDLFCQINMLVVLAHLEQSKKAEQVAINIVDENSGKLISTKKVLTEGFLNAYVNLCQQKATKTGLKSLDNAIKEYFAKK